MVLEVMIILLSRSIITSQNEDKNKPTKCTD